MKKPLPPPPIHFREGHHPTHGRGGPPVITRPASQTIGRRPASVFLREVEFREWTEPEPPSQPIGAGQNCYVPARTGPQVPLGICFILMGLAFSGGYWWAMVMGVSPQ
jgi:hypothetical protein